jgi:spore germination protein GerM
MNARGRSLRRLSVLWLVPLALAACALPTQRSPSAIPASRVPFHLLDPHPPTTTTTQPKVSSYISAKVYFLNADANNALTPADRLVSAPAQLPAILTVLVSGPSSAEEASGLTTAIPSDVVVLSAAETSPNVVTVNFNTAFEQISGTASEQAVAQVVTTVVGNTSPATGVVFEINGVHTSVPVANGSDVAGPVYLLDVAP